MVCNHLTEYWQMCQALRHFAESAGRRYFIAKRSVQKSSLETKAHMKVTEC